MQFFDLKYFRVNNYTGPHYLYTLCHWCSYSLTFSILYSLHKHEYKTDEYIYVLIN